MPDFHGEPYIYLAGLTHDSALIAWGAFYFRVKEKTSELKLLDDEEIEPALRETIGARSTPYGPARVVVRNKRTGTEVPGVRVFDANHCWVPGLESDTEYTYQVFITPTGRRNTAAIEDEWAKGERWDWSHDGGRATLRPGGRYDHTFRTFPDPKQPAPRFSFAVLGDFGVGIKNKSDEDHRQREVAFALRKAVDQFDVRFLLTTGDNIYAGSRFLWITTSQGDEDDDWFFTYFQPYRYILNRIPVYPTIGNHDTGEAESVDDRDQLFDNLYLNERFAGEDKYGRASLGPGLFYRFNYGRDVELIALDTSKERLFGARLIDHPKHNDFVERAFSAQRSDRPKWQIPVSHHPPFSAGPFHSNTTSMHRLLPLFEAAGVRAMLSGHEHNFQHSIHNGIHYVISGGGGKLRRSEPSQAGYAAAHTQSWAGAFNFLIVTIDGDTMTIRPFTESDGEPVPLERKTPGGLTMDSPIVVAL
jgi:tartrate-resistant acid phosphatase type 5